MRKIMATVNAFLAGDDQSPASLVQMEPERAISAMLYYGDYMLHYDNWIHVGKATITVTLDDDPVVIERLIQSIDAQIKQADADHEVSRNALLEKRNSLLAIEYKP